MGDASVNGDMPHSATLEHIQKYPLVADSISTFKSYPIGQKSIDVTNAAYNSLVKPTFPYLETPAAYAKPYVAKADEIGDSLLSKVDEKVPIVKSETKELQSTLYSYISYPYTLFDETKSYVFEKYNNEYQKCGGDGVVASSKALVSAGLVITSEAASYLSSLLQKKQAEAKEALEKAEGEVKSAAKNTEKQAKATKEQAKEKTSN